MVGLREPWFWVEPPQRLQGRQLTQEKKARLNHRSSSSTRKSSNPSLQSTEEKPGSGSVPAGPTRFTHPNSAQSASK